MLSISLACAYLGWRCGNKKIVQTISLLGNEGFSFFSLCEGGGEGMVYVECLNFLLHDPRHVVKSLEDFILYE